MSNLFKRLLKTTIKSVAYFEIIEKVINITHDIYLVHSSNLGLWSYHDSIGLVINKVF